MSQQPISQDDEMTAQERANLDRILASIRDLKVTVPMTRGQRIVTPAGTLSVRLAPLSI